MPFILTYTEIDAELTKITPILTDTHIAGDRACHLAINELETLAADLEATAKHCPDVPHLDGLRDNLLDTAERLTDRRLPVIKIRETEVEHLEVLHTQIAEVIRENSDAEDYVREIRQSDEPVEVAEDAEPMFLKQGEAASVLSQQDAD